ncbi:MAG: hypothetical protein KY455_10795 [Euryarchaeota archaeon]|nr:hypothetical protein [Euryarchaeota archaeon]
MKRIFTIMLVAAFATASVPAADAGEVITGQYDVPSGAIRLSPSTGCGVATCGPGLTWSICTPGWDDWEGGVLSSPDDDALGGPLTTGFSTACGSARDATGAEGNHGAVNIGVSSSTLQSICGDCYTDFLVSVTDTLPADTYYTFCVITEYQDGRDDGDNWCGEDPSGEPDDIEDPRAAGCGEASLTSAVPAGGEENVVTAFVYGSHVDETSGQVCLGSKGSLTVDMS